MTTHNNREFVDENVDHEDGQNASRRHVRHCFRIAMVCDFFHPSLGGVENHIYSLSYHLAQLKHKVIVITHAYPEHNRFGVRYLPGPVKVYYCPFTVMTDRVIMPTFLATLPLMRWIFLRERIDIVHAHQATSAMANESLVYASALGLASVYTDHSLFGVDDDVPSMILNRVLQTTLATVNAVIGVSHACCDNLILRARLGRRELQQSKRNRQLVTVIPNAVDPTKFTPPDDSSNLRRGCDDHHERITVVVVSRLVYRKGVDLLTCLIPLVCAREPRADFLIGGDGPKRLQLQEMIEAHRLQQRVQVMGAVPHHHVRAVLNRGQIFLNCSLTESFCIALLEAACCGLLCVSTRVGGVPEVLPPDLIRLCRPTVPEMVETLVLAIQQHLISPLDPWHTHHRVAAMYSWKRVAEETTTSVYERSMRMSMRIRAPYSTRTEAPTTTHIGIFSQPRLQLRLQRLKERLTCYYEAHDRSALGMGVCVLTIILELVLMGVEWWQPKSDIDVIPDWIGENHCNDNNENDNHSDNDSATDTDFD